MSGPTQRGNKIQCRGWEVGECPVGGARSQGQEESRTVDEVVQLGERWWSDLWATLRSLGFSLEGNRSHGRALNGG